MNQDSIASASSHPEVYTLASIAVALRRLDNSCPIPRWLGYEVLGMLNNMILEIDPLLSQKIHSDLNQKPFTVSSLIRMGKGQYLIRFTTLMPELYKILMQVLLGKFRDGYRIRLRECEFDIERLILGGVSERFASVTDYHSVWQNTSRKKFRFRFVSPTSFKSGDGNLPFPLPYSLYHGLLIKWNQFAPNEFKIDEGILQTVMNHVFPSHHSIHTVVIEQKRNKLIGFVGNCTFDVIGEVSEEMLQQLTVLTEYAYYAGVGMKTTQGMGQVLIAK